MGIVYVNGNWGRVYRSVASALAAGLLCASFLPEIQAGEWGRRVLPANATPLPDASEDQQPLDYSQKIEIARETVCASMRAMLRNPIRSTARLYGRDLERAGERLRETSTILLPPRGCSGGNSCPEVGGGFGGPLTDARLTLYPSSESSLQALLALVSVATRRIDLMMYGWQDDPTGREVAQALADAAGRGVRVRLLADRTAYLIHNPPAAKGEYTFLDALRGVPNVALLEPPGAFVRFDHRKLAVIDGRVAWTGGMILTEAARRRWQNLAFVAEGPIVPQYAWVFEERWREVGGSPENPAELAMADPGIPANATVRLIQTNVGERSLKNSVYHAVDHARHHIYLENCYFSDEILTAKLAAAQRRGVDVRAVLTLRGNVPRLNSYMRITCNRLFRAGAKVYLYPRMTHVKAMSVDGAWAYIGTGNFDELSLRNNNEVGLAVSSVDVATQLDNSFFIPDMAVSEQVCALMPGPKNRLMLELLDLWY